MFQPNGCSTALSQIWVLSTINFSKIFLLKVSLIIFRQEEKILRFVDSSICYACNPHLTLKTSFFYLKKINFLLNDCRAFSKLWSLTLIIAITKVLFLKRRLDTRFSLQSIWPFPKTLTFKMFSNSCTIIFMLDIKNNFTCCK